MADPTAFIDITSAEARAAERGTDGEEFRGGVNLSGACAIGIGINIDGGENDLNAWTLLDQRGDARTPQNSQHIGGNGLSAGIEGAVGAPILTGQPSPGGRIDINGEATLAVIATGWEAVGGAFENQLTVGVAGGDYGFEVGLFGTLSPLSVNSIDIDRLIGSFGIITVQTALLTPLFGNSNIIISVEGAPSGGYEIAQDTPGAGLYESVQFELAQYLTEQLGNTLGVTIVSA